MEIGLCLGTNLGDRLANLQAAGEALDALEGGRVIARSRVYETEPVDVAKEHRNRPFLNAVLVLETSLDVYRLSHEVHVIEQQLGRVRTGDRNAPRVIDIDILYANGIEVDSEELAVPHPHWAQRRFVVQPLADVRPDFVMPGQSRTVREVLMSLPPGPRVVPSRRQW